MKTPLGPSKARGYALVVVLLVIASLTLMGMVAMETIVVDLEIARSHKEVRESFYLAEAAVMEGVQLLLNGPAVDRKECIYFWHHDQSAVEAGEADFSDADQWQVADPLTNNALQSSLDPHAYLAATEDRVAAGSSLVATESRLYINRLYGRCTKYNTHSLVLVGYYMRY